MQIEKKKEEIFAKSLHSQSPCRFYAVQLSNWFSHICFPRTGSKTTIYVVLKKNEKITVQFGRNIAQQCDKEKLGEI